MVDIDAKTVMALRKRTGAPMMDCKAALKTTEGDMDKAVEELRKKGLQTADKKAGREATEGTVFSYSHHNGKLGVLVEVACETDFVARNEEFQQFGRDLCLHITAMNPRFLSRDQVDEAAIADEKRILNEQARETMAGKPDEVIEKVIEGRLGKFFADQCLLEQPWVRDDKQTVEQVCRTLSGKTGEKLEVRHFHRMELGG
jgi:elongation factor Ts